MKAKEHAVELETSVATAKQQVYDKVKQQFDEGNQQYQKLRKQMKHVEENSQQLTRNLEERDRQLAVATVSYNALSSTMNMLQEMIREIGQALNIATTTLNTASVSNGSTGSTMIALKPVYLKAIQEKTLQYQELVCQRDQFKAVICTLESALANKDAIILSCQTEARNSNDRAAVAEALLSTSRFDLMNKEKEYDLQQKNLAVITKANEEMTLRCELLEKAKLELDSRCIRLRKMNEELVVLLEKVKQEKEESTATSG
jgi:chromosome segregation ATPase